MKIAFDVDVLAKQMSINDYVHKVADWGYKYIEQSPHPRINPFYKHPLFSKEAEAEYRQAEEAFFSVLDQYHPQYIIAWGNRLWGEMPGGERWRDGDDITIDGYTVNTGNYALSGGGRVKVMAVNHPSVGYSWDWWHKVIETFLKR